MTILGGRGLEVRSATLSAPAFKPRVHVLLASRAPLGVVIRRGPSKSVCTMLWDRRRDTFHMGQWLKGRIYERRCDLSPDGQFLIYFAMNGAVTSETGGSYTAISRAPFLKADVLLGKGGAWNGGGLFLTNTTYWLNDGYGHVLLRDSRKVRREVGYRPPRGYGGECPGVYYNRLLRDGWRILDGENDEKRKDADIFEKYIGKAWVLRKIAHADVKAPEGKGCYWDEHELVHGLSNRRFTFPTWEWADMDGTRLVWVSEGKLFEGSLSHEGLTREAELHDFNGMTFERIRAPY